MDGFCPAPLLLWRNEWNPTEYVSILQVYLGGDMPSSRGLDRQTVTLPVAVLLRQLLRHSCVAGCQAATGRWYWHSVELAGCEVLTAVRYKASTDSDVPNESSAFEMYQVVRCHIPEDLCLRAAEFVVQLIDFGVGPCRIGRELWWLVLGSA
jgi:hypothetical protein